MKEKININIQLSVTRSQVISNLENNK